MITPDRGAINHTSTYYYYRNFCADRTAYVMRSARLGENSR